MFYAQFVLAKKGPLAKIWLAAHWEKKLTKAQIYETDVPQAIEEVIRPKVKMALRTVGHLLLGIVRIYSKKTRYLLADTNEAYLKMKVNFRDGFSFEADLPLNADIDENFAGHDDFNITVPDFHDSEYNEKMIMANVSRLEDITIRDDVNYNAMFQINADEDGFGDEMEYGQLEQLYGSVEPSSLRPTPQPESMMEMARDASIHGSIVSNRDDGTIHLTEGERPVFQGMDFDDFAGGDGFQMKQENATFGDALDDPRDSPGPHQPMMFDSVIHHDEPADYFGGEPEVEPHRVPSPESFELEPLDLENLEGGRKRRQRRPRKLLVDAETMISNEAFRQQQEDFTDTMQEINMAPPSRRMLHLCVSGDLPHLMSLPGSSIKNRELLKMYREHLVTQKFDPNFTMAEISDSSSFTQSMEAAAPWEDLELNENIPEVFGDEYEAAGAADDFYGDIDFDPVVPMDFDRTLGQIPEDQMDPGPVEYPGENKENEEEEDWQDPFGSVSRKNRLEAYGFGATPKSAATPSEDEGKWAKRSKQILKQVSTSIETTGQAVFSSVTANAKTRKQAAEQFYSLLSLAKSQAISVEQEEPYGEIVIRAGEKFRETLMPPAVETTMRTPMRPI
uniref:Rad21_Rec8_N domain-containing protein n=1 Tax=Caenorhabditis tropicalis TaxID=1561998 RepID=A0A1I7T3P8_9PELO